MSLAARCPSCGTVFRVVQDQLRVSEGWVRCGRCAEVFNAIESLVDLDADIAAARRAPAPQHSSRRDRVLDDLESVSRFDEQADALSPLSTFGTPDAPLKVQERSLQGRASIVAPAPVPETTIEAAVAEAAAARIEAASLRPAFVRQAERAARWRRPGVRLALGMLAAASALALLAQIGLEYRHVAAARWPVLRALFEQACDVAGCRVEPPRLIDALAVESSGLVRIESTSLYRLNVVLRNRTPMALALPALDLTLTDSQGGVMARRVITPQELGVQRVSVPGGAELPMQATLNSAERPISGYTIEIFYP
ncbi:MAG: zinc-ribbon and DUF3426 domain-containing protein [Bacteroidia bacterium]|jgi:predicted Zn finger-like uncharacterized protein